MKYFGANSFTSRDCLGLYPCLCFLLENVFLAEGFQEDKKEGGLIILIRIIFLG